MIYRRVCTKGGAHIVTDAHSEQPRHFTYVFLALFLKKKVLSMKNPVVVSSFSEAFFFFVRVLELLINFVLHALLLPYASVVCRR